MKSDYTLCDPINIILLPLLTLMIIKLNRERPILNRKTTARAECTERIDKGSVS